MSSELVQTGFFDLELTQEKTWHVGLEDKLQNMLRQRAAKIKAVVAQANFIIGEELATAQKELTYKNGGFVKWLEEEVGIDFERAYEFIRIWENYKMFALSANISSLGKKVLLAGAKKDVPESARQEIVTRHEAGEKITLAATDEIIARHKAEVEELKETNQELQREYDLFKDDRERERREYDSRLTTIETEKSFKEDEILGYKQAKAVIDQKLKSNQEEIERLKADLEEKPEPEKVEVEVEKLVTPPEVEENIKSMKERIAALEEEQSKLLSASSSKSSELEELAQERDKLAKEVDGLKKLANDNLFAETQAKYEAEVKDANRKMSSIFDKALRDARALLPSPIDAKQAYGGDEWARVMWMRSQATRFVEELDRLKENIGSLFVDVSPVDTSRFIAPPTAYIEADSYA